LWDGPATVKEQISAVNVLIDEPLKDGTVKTHVVHVSRLKLCTERKPGKKTFPEVALWDNGEPEEATAGGESQQQSLPPPTSMEGHLFYEVETIVGHYTERIRTKRGKIRKGGILYHVKFLGYPVDPKDWYPTSSLKRSRATLDAYKAQFGEEMPEEWGDLTGKSATHFEESETEPAPKKR